MWPIVCLYVCVRIYQQGDRSRSRHRLGCVQGKGGILLSPVTHPHGLQTANDVPRGMQALDVDVVPQGQRLPVLQRARAALDLSVVFMGGLNDELLGFWGFGQGESTGAERRHNTGPIGLGLLVYGHALLLKSFTDLVDRPAEDGYVGQALVHGVVAAGVVPVCVIDGGVGVK